MFLNRLWTPSRARIEQDGKPTFGYWPCPPPPEHAVWTESYYVAEVANGHGESERMPRSFGYVGRLGPMGLWEYDAGVGRKGKGRVLTREQALAFVIAAHN